MQSITRLSRPVLAKCCSSAPLSRSFSILSPLRPTLSQTSFRPNLTSFTASPSPAASTPTGSSTGAVADLVPRTTISAHPAFGGVSQIRCGPRNTMNGHTRLVQKRRHGWLYRMKTKSGRKILLRRKLKGRRNVAW